MLYQAVPRKLNSMSGRKNRSSRRPNEEPTLRSWARKRINKSRVGFHELTGTVHSSARPPAHPPFPRPLLLPEAAARKRTKERGIKEGRGSKEAQAHAHTYIRIYCVGSFPLNVLRAELLAINIKKPKKEIEERVDVDIRRGIGRRQHLGFDLNSPLHFSAADCVVCGLLLLSSSLKKIQFQPPSPSSCALWSSTVPFYYCKCSFILVLSVAPICRVAPHVRLGLSYFE